MIYQFCSIIHVMSTRIVPWGQRMAVIRHRCWTAECGSRISGAAECAVGDDFPRSRAHRCCSATTCALSSVQSACCRPFPVRFRAGSSQQNC